MNLYLPEGATLLAFTSVALVVTATPGPDMALQVSNTINYSRRAGIFTLFGTWTGIFTQAILAACGLSALLAASPTLFEAVKIIGALYLLWLAVTALRANANAGIETGRAHKPVREIYLQALTVNLLNPNVILFFVALLPQFVDPSSPHAGSQLAILGLWFAILSVPVQLAIVLFASAAGSKFFGNAQVRCWMNRILAIAFGLFALTLLIGQFA